MPESGCPCSHDCFNCLYADCVCGDDDIDDMTALEIAEAEARDRRTERYNCEADYPREATDSIKAHKRRAYRRTYYYRHRDAEIQKRREKYAANREEINAARREYYLRNRERINQQKREKRALQKAAKTGGNYGTNGK